MDGEGRFFRPQGEADPSIVAISAIELLKSFVNVSALDNHELRWKVGIHVTLIVSGVLFAVMDRIAGGEARPQQKE